MLEENEGPLAGGVKALPVGFEEAEVETTYVEAEVPTEAQLPEVKEAEIRLPRTNKEKDQHVARSILKMAQSGKGVCKASVVNGVRPIWSMSPDAKVSAARAERAFGILLRGKQIKSVGPQMCGGKERVHYVLAE